MMVFPRKGIFLRVGDRQDMRPLKTTAVTDLAIKTLEDLVMMAGLDLMKYFTAQDIFLVTGATSGFGEGVVLNLLAQGATVVAVGRSQEKLTQLKAKLHDSKRLICENRDLVNTTKLDRWVVEVSKKYGRLKGLVLCAGTQQIDPLRAPMAVEKSRQLFELNYFANMQLAKGFCDLRAHVKSD